MRTIVRQVPCPRESRIADWLPGADLADAFVVDLTGEDAALGIEALARSTLGHPAPWLRALLSIRDKAVRPFGVKSSRQLRQQAVVAGAEHIDFFRIVPRSRDEIVLDEDGRLSLSTCMGQHLSSLICDGFNLLVRPIGGHLLIPILFQADRGTVTVNSSGPSSRNTTGECYVAKTC